jgi:hypothetical protein
MNAKAPCALQFSASAGLVYRVVARKVASFLH